MSFTREVPNQKAVQQALLKREQSLLTFDRNIDQMLRYHYATLRVSCYGDYMKRLRDFIFSSDTPA